MCSLFCQHPCRAIEVNEPLQWLYADRLRKARSADVTNAKAVSRSGRRGWNACRPPQTMLAQWQRSRCNAGCGILSPQKSCMITSKLPAKERWEANLPINLKELAECQGVSYSTANKWAKDDDFPRVGRLLKREQFEAWWKKAARQRTGARPPRSASCKSHAPTLKSDLPGALPPRAARLLDEAVSRK